MRAKRQFEHAMADSTELLQIHIDGVAFGIGADNFLLQELGRLIQDGEPSFDNDDFHFVVKQGIRFDVNPRGVVRLEVAARFEIPALRALQFAGLGIHGRIAVRAGALYQLQLGHHGFVSAH